MSTHVGGKITGSRTIDGVHVIVANHFSENLGEVLLVRYDDYLAALARAAAPPAPIDTAAIPVNNPWREAVLDELIVSHVYRTEHDDNPKLAIQDAISWHCKVALDPSVSSDAQALVAGACGHIRDELLALDRRLTEAADDLNTSSLDFIIADLRTIAAKLGTTTDEGMKG